MSPLCFISIFLIILIIPTLIYIICMLLKSPPSPFCFCFPCISLRPSPTPQRRTSTDQKPTRSSSSSASTTTEPDVAVVVVVSDIPTTGNNNESTTPTSECSVCLSALQKGGEEIRQLNLCKHIFHTYCIDRWLYDHSNCPVCRSCVTAVSKPNSTFHILNHSQPPQEDDLWQGSPDSAGMV